MTSSIDKRLTFLLIVIMLFMTNVSLWSKHSNWLTHELEHTVSTAYSSAVTDYVLLHNLNIEASDEATSSTAIEHELLHAASHLPLFLIEVLNTATSDIFEAVRSYQYNAQIPAFKSEPPFRPPWF